MKEGESVEEFYNRVIILVNQMRINGEVIEDRRIIEKIMRSFTRKFEYVVVAIEESNDISTLSLESLLGTLQSHEFRMRLFDEGPVEQAFHTSTKNGVFKGKQPNPLCEIQCYYCHKYGHTLKHCKKRQEDEGVDAKFVSEYDSKADDTMFMTFETDELIKNDDWQYLTENDDLIVAVDDALHSSFWRLD